MLDFMKNLTLVSQSYVAKDVFDVSFAVTLFILCLSIEGLSTIDPSTISIFEVELNKDRDKIPFR